MDNAFLLSSILGGKDEVAPAMMLLFFSDCFDILISKLLSMKRFYDDFYSESESLWLQSPRNSSLGRRMGVGVLSSKENQTNNHQSSIPLPVTSNSNPPITISRKSILLLSQTPLPSTDNEDNEAVEAETENGAGATAYLINEKREEGREDKILQL